MRLSFPAILCLLVATSATRAQNSIILLGNPAAGSTSLQISSDANQTIAVYQFASTVTLSGKLCTGADIPNGTALSIVSSSSTSTTALTFPAPTASPYSITLAQPLVAGMRLCATEVPDAGTPITYSNVQTVTDPNDYGRFRAIFTGGVMINNQQSAANSTTAGEYLDMQLITTWVIGGQRLCADSSISGCRAAHAGVSCATSLCHKGRLLAPGFATFFNARLSPIPVAASTTTTTSTATTAGPPTTNLNVLTSQQALRVLVGVNFPFRSRGWNSKTNAFTVGPTARASFDTVLNPSVSNATSSTAGTTTQTTGDFSSVYSSWGIGVRTSWDQFPASSDKAPQTLAEFNFLLGKFSNLPSYECLPGTATASAVSKTSCETSDTISRILIPRLDISGFVKFPNYPFVLGFDANLAQYGLPGTPNNIDISNKPGNDVRIYIGYTMDLSSIFKLL